MNCYQFFIYDNTECDCYGNESLIYVSELYLNEEECRVDARRKIIECCDNFDDDERFGYVCQHYQLPINNLNS